MEDIKFTTLFLDCTAVVVVVAWFIFMIRILILCWKHDLYIKKYFPNISIKESVSIFGGNWSGISIMSNLFSKSAPTDYIFQIRKKIRYAWLGGLLSITLLPIMFLILLVIIMASMRILGYLL